MPATHDPERRRLGALALVTAALAGCASAPSGWAPMPSPAATAAGNEVVLTALHYLEVGYVTGGSSAAEGFDCSGFTRHVMARVLGLRLPRRAEDQALRAGWPPVPRDALAPGDLVFFNTLRRPHSHVGIYVGDGRFVHAPRSGARIRIEPLTVRYWAERFDGARRAPL